MINCEFSIIMHDNIIIASYQADYTIMHACMHERISSIQST